MCKDPQKILHKWSTGPALVLHARLGSGVGVSSLLFTIAANGLLALAEAAQAPGLQMKQLQSPSEGPKRPELVPLVAIGSGLLKVRGPRGLSM